MFFEHIFLSLSTCLPPWPPSLIPTSLSYTLIAKTDYAVVGEAPPSPGRGRVERELRCHTCNRKVSKGRDIQIHTYIYIHTCMYAYTYIHTIHTYICMHACMHAHTTHTYVCTYIHVHTYIHTTYNRKGRHCECHTYTIPNR